MISVARRCRMAAGRFCLCPSHVPQGRAVCLCSLLLLIRVVDIEHVGAFRALNNTWRAMSVYIGGVLKPFGGTFPWFGPSLQLCLQQDPPVGPSGPGGLSSGGSYMELLG